MATTSVRSPRPATRRAGSAKRPASPTPPHPLRYLVDYYKPKLAFAAGWFVAGMVFGAILFSGH